MIDRSGRLFGKVSLLDIFVLGAVVFLFASFLLGQVTEQAELIVAPSEEFYVTFEINGARLVVAEALDLGAVVYRMHAGQAFGVVVDIEELKPALQVTPFRDGTAELLEMDERYRLRFTVRATGSITSLGHFVNGNDHVSMGSWVNLVSTRAFLSESEVVAITRN